MESLNKGWLYGLIVMLSQTCNPDYQQPSPYSGGNEYSIQDDRVVEIPADALSEDQIIYSEEAPPPPPPPPEPVPFEEPEMESIFKVVEDMPRFPGCEEKSSKDERSRCAQDEMFAFIGKEMKYPAEARGNGVEGTVIVRFVVEKNGDISNVDLLRDPGAGCGAEAVRVVKAMPKWVPGKQRGKPVKVQYTLPVKFKL